MFKTVAFYAFSAFLWIGSPASAAEDCDLYTVVKGDTLRVIAERYYGKREFSPILYDANIAVIGPSANTIEIGMELTIPCHDGIQMPLAAMFLAAETPVNTGGPIPHFLATSGGSPFISVDGSGIIPNILGAALRKAGYLANLELEYIESNHETLEVASLDGSALLSFPWIRPDCQNADILSSQSRNLCENFLFSDPLYEITLGMFVRSDDPLSRADTPAHFADKSICVPPFHSTDMLRENGIFNVLGSLTRAPDFTTCLSGIATGEFDVIVADYRSFAEFSSSEEWNLTDIPAFARITTIHTVAYAQNQDALAVLELVNSGLQQILASGEWFDIVKQHQETRIN